MKTLIVLTGARGAGKTSIINGIKSRNSARVLKTFTTRTRREGETDEDYYFLDEPPHENERAWQIKVGENYYGMLISEIESKSDAPVLILPFEPMNLGVLEQFENLYKNFEVITIGIDTIENEEIQKVRVNNEEKRLDGEENIKKIRETLKSCDLSVRGDETQNIDAVDAVCRLRSLRGGIVTREYLRPLMLAGSIIVDEDDSSIEDDSRIQGASYDLSVGSEVWCSGIKELADNNNSFSIPPYSYAIVKAGERACLPTFLVGQFDLKVSLFLKGVILSNGPQVDPGYVGDLFCLLFNANSEPCRLKKGDHFSTIHFATTVRAVERYKTNYHFTKSLAKHMDADAAQGNAGAIFDKIDNGLNDVKGEVEKNLTKAFSLLALLFTVGAGAVVWTLILSNSATTAADAAAKAAQEAAFRVERMLDDLSDRDPSEAPQQ